MMKDFNAKVAAENEARRELEIQRLNADLHERLEEERRAKIKEEEALLAKREKTQRRVDQLLQDAGRKFISAGLRHAAWRQRRIEVAIERLKNLRAVGGSGGGAGALQPGAGAGYSGGGGGGGGNGAGMGGGAELTLRGPCRTSPTTTSHSRRWWTSPKRRCGPSQHRREPLRVHRAGRRGRGQGVGADP